MQEDNHEAAKTGQPPVEGHDPATAADEMEAMRARLEAAETELARLKDEHLRDRAEVENQRRRMARELEQSRRFANEKVLRELLPVCDNLERGMSTDHPGGDGLLEGMALTLKSLLKVMQDHGLEQLDPQGAPFNPEYHEAMSLVDPQADQQPGTVVTVLEKGYVLNDRLLRPARVVVTKDN